MTIVPKPHVSFLLDADPVQARARKPEYPLEFLHTNRASYIALTELIGGITIIDPMPAREAHEHIWKHVLKQLSLDECQYTRSTELLDADHRVHAPLDEEDVHPNVS
ncbi:hypothetical protein H7849_04270 [Alloacidobacterium dinghuense]|uniref:Uncharacterized protein n=1 Tax=Alloacidobacterium dinghuense TaxID=2763107 RepID=A0A7G8BKX3_9BACT|nr:hypothetical protein [Alloacidobacterium dinghuense]QNI33193.1 hypothetical protein H7849_04270 [Alloacidobacterium dinghuense]